MIFSFPKNIGNNLLVLLILFGLGYIIYTKMKGGSVNLKFAEALKRK